MKFYARITDMWELGRQPLFRLLAAFIVLLVADWNPVYGLAAFLLWTAWVAWSIRKTPSRSRYFAQLS